jgi:CheY-like chemotaxis protein
LPSNKLTILLVDDDGVDAEAVERAFRKADVSTPLVVASDGVEALEKLRGTDGSPPLPRPLVILLDLNMPRMNGIEFLDELRADPALRDHVVFVLTTSDDNRDKIAAYQRQVAGYLVKSNVGHNFTQLINLLQHYEDLIEMPPAQ